MIKLQIYKLVQRSVLAIILYAILELYGGIFIGVAISAFFDKQLLTEYAISNTLIIFGVIAFIVRSVGYFLITKWLLSQAFEFTRQLINRHCQSILTIKPGSAVSSEKFLSNITHEALSLQANGVTPLLFVLSDAFSCLLMIIVGFIFSWQITLSFAGIALVCMLIWSKVAKVLQTYANKRAVSEQNKIKLATSLILSRSIYSTGQFINSFHKDFNQTTSLNAQYGALHQSTVQLPRIIIESLVIILCALLITRGVAISGSNLISVAIMLRTIPNFQRIVYNIGNLRAAQVSINILQNAEQNQYDRADFLEDLSVEQIDFDLHITTSGKRYPEIMTITRGMTVITGPSGTGKSYLVRSICNRLTLSNYSSLYIHREIVEDETLFHYLVNEINLDAVNNDEITQSLKVEIQSIVTKQLRHQRLSTGERERLLIIYLSQQTHDYIFLDELFINIPKDKKLQYFKVFTELRRDYTSILISHDTEILQLRNSPILTLA